MQSEPPAAGLQGEDCLSTVLGLTELFHAMSLGKKDVSYFETTYIGYR